MTSRVDSLGKYGLNKDAAAFDLAPGAFSDAGNMRFRDGYAERMRGQSQIFTAPSVTPYCLFSYRSGTSKYWVHLGTASAFVDDGTTRTDLTPGTPFTGAVDDRWTGGVASGVLVVNNGVDKPQYWGGNVANDFAALTAWDANWRCASLRPFKNYLVACDVTKSGTRYANMVKWSAAADPGALPASWDAADATKDAGEQDLAETPDQIVDQLRMGDINVIYKERSIYGMQYIGDPYIFRFYRLPGDMGLLARGCVVNTPMGHVVLSPGDVILHSGQGPRSIINGKMRRWLFNSIDSTYYARSFLVASYPTNEVWICFPESGQTACTMALVWNWNDDTLGVRQLLNATYGASGQVISSSSGTWAADTDTWAVDSTAWGNDGFAAAEERLILCESTPMLSIIETGASWNGTSKTCFVERSGLHFDAPDKVKTCRGIIPRIDASPGTVLSVEIGASMDAEVAPTWQLPVTYTVGTSRKVDAFATGRYLAYRITSTGTDAWRLNSVDFDIVSRGNY